MRTIGNLLFLLLLALVGFGFLLSHSMNLTRDLTDAQTEMTRMQEELQTLEAQYQALLQENNRLSDQVTGLTSENVSLHTQMEAVESERRALSDQVEALQRKLALAEKSASILSWLFSSSRIHLFAALLVVPVLPLSFGAAYVYTHPKRRTPPAIPMTGPGQNHPSLQSPLTLEEYLLIVQRRKSRAFLHPAGPRSGGDDWIKG